MWWDKPAEKKTYSRAPGPHREAGWRSFPGLGEILADGAAIRKTRQKHGKKHRFQRHRTVNANIKTPRGMEKQRDIKIHGRTMQFKGQSCKG